MRRVSTQLPGPGADTSIQMCIGFVVLAVLLLGSAPTRAQPLGETIVVPVRVADQAPDVRVAEAIERYLRDRGVPAVPMHDGRDRFLRVSSPSHFATDEDIEAVAAGARRALEAVAFGRRSSAEQAVHDVMSLVEPILASLNRETTSARHLLDACLALVRLDLQAGQRDVALQQAMRCRALVPDLSPDPRMHPSAVIGAVAEVDNQLRRLQGGGLRVQSSAPESGCAVYVNGRHLGVTPLDVEALPPANYRVQVECGQERGRVHAVSVGEGVSSLQVDTSFDQAIRTESRLRLQYEQPTPSAIFAAHAVEIGRTVQITDVILVEARDGGATLTRVRVRDGRAVARQWAAAALTPDSDALHRMAEGILQGRFESEPLLMPPDISATQVEVREAVEGTAEAPQHEAAHSVTSTPALRKRPSAIRRFTVPTALATLGGASFAAAIAFNAMRRSAGDKLRSTEPMDRSYTFQLEDWQDSRSKIYAFGIVGALLADGAAAWFATACESHSTLMTWASGAVGLGMVAWGLADLVRGERCDGPVARRKECSADEERLDRGSLVLMGASPFLTFSLTSGIRGMRARGVNVSWSIHPEVNLKRGSVALANVLSWR
jgi:hypothetical protein